MGTQKHALHHVAAPGNGSRAMLRTRGFVPRLLRAPGPVVPIGSSFGAASAPRRKKSWCSVAPAIRDGGGIDTPPGYSYYSS